MLYLVRRQELTLAELSLSTLCEQYGRYVEVLQALDLTDVGDFLEVAATLIEMKSLSAIPRVEEPSAEARVATVAETPAEMVGRLLEYRQIRDAAAVLDEMGTRWQRRYLRPSHPTDFTRVDPADADIIDAQLWDLVSAFGRIMRESAGPPEEEVIDDDTPIHVYMQRIHERLVDEPQVALTDLVEGGEHKTALIGWFLATLELTRHHGAAVVEDEFGDIAVVRTENYRRELDVAEVDSYAKRGV